MDILRTKAKWREMFGGRAPSPGQPSIPVEPATRPASDEAPAQAASTTITPVAPANRDRPRYEQPFAKLPKKHPQMDRYLYNMKVTTDRKSPKIATKAEGEGITILDVNQHAIVFGETGTGKTLRWLHHIYEGFYESTHLSLKDGRDARKFCGFVVDGKTDFTPTSWSLAKKYGRAEDMIFFGPTHLDNSYNPFGDADETPFQRAQKMLELIKATKPDAGGGDPFWDNAASKLFSNIFLLHEAAHRAVPERVPAMSFRLLNQLCTDKGQYRNIGEIQNWIAGNQKLVGELYNLCGILRKMAYSLTPEIDKTHARVVALQSDLKKQTKYLTEEWKDAYSLQVRYSGEDTREKARLERDADLKAHELKKMAGRNAMVGLAKLALGGFHQLEGLPDIPGNLAMQLQHVGGEAGAFEHSEGDRREAIENFFFRSGFLMMKLLYESLSQVEGEIFGVTCYEGLKEFCDKYNTILSLIKMSAELVKKEPPKKSGQMRKLLDIYVEKVLEPEKRSKEDDPIHEYFEGEHLNVCNDKTAGSVGMVATNMCNTFVHEPFCYMFREDATWNWNEVIDEGKIVIMDMPFVQFQAAAVMASLLLKTDFFRTVLSRKLIKITDPKTGQERLLNQEREILYLVDEFQTVVSTGKITGEFAFLDRCRSNRCSCIFATQSLSNFYASLSEKDGEAILANVALKVFFRNSCGKTNDYASRMSGEHIRLTISMQGSAVSQYFGNSGVGATGGSQSSQKGAKYEPAFFSSMSDGNAMLRLPARFGKENVVVTKLDLHIIKDPEPNYVIPTAIEPKPLGETMIKDEKKKEPEPKPAAA